MYGFMILAVTADPMQEWRTIGFSLDQVRGQYADGIASGKFLKPAYLVVCRRKPQTIKSWSGVDG